MPVRATGGRAVFAGANTFHPKWPIAVQFLVFNFYNLSKSGQLRVVPFPKN
ncbi:MAG: hypothetical protein ACI9K9_002297, partial [Neolewinella sp.]